MCIQVLSQWHTSDPQIGGECTTITGVHHIRHLYVCNGQNSSQMHTKKTHKIIPFQLWICIVYLCACKNGSRLSSTRLQTMSANLIHPLSPDMLLSRHIRALVQRHHYPIVTSYHQPPPHISLHYTWDFCSVCTSLSGTCVRMLGPTYTIGTEDTRGLQ